MLASRTLIRLAQLQQPLGWKLDRNIDFWGNHHFNIEYFNLKDGSRLFALEQMLLPMRKLD